MAKSASGKSSRKESSKGQSADGQPGSDKRATGKAAGVRGSATGRPIMRLLDALGRRWSLRILWELREERLNFRDLRARCDDVSPTSLNARLKELRELGLVDLDDQGFGYTPLGRELGEHLLRLSRWSEKWNQHLGH